MNNQKKVFVLKTYDSKLYKWSPESNTKNKTIKPNLKNSFCSATSGSQGQDWTTNYIYDLVVINNQQERLAYFECDYIQ